MQKRAKLCKNGNGNGDDATVAIMFVFSYVDSSNEHCFCCLISFINL